MIDRDKPAPTLVTTRRTGGGIVIGRQLPPGEERDPSHGGWTLRAWYQRRPATTIVGTFSPHIVSPPGHRSFGPGAASRQNAVGGVAITIEEALILQDFPPNYPLQGVKTRKFLQVGNAIPRGLALAVLSPLVKRVA